MTMLQYYVEAAENAQVLADQAESRSELPEARQWARRAGDNYMFAAYEATRAAGGVDDGSKERTVSWLEGARLMRLSSQAYLRGLSRNKAVERARVAANWEEGTAGRAFGSVPQSGEER